jgi:hypothetical protein
MAAFSHGGARESMRMMRGNFIFSRVIAPTKIAVHPSAVPVIVGRIAAFAGKPAIAVELSHFF